MSNVQRQFVRCGGILPQILASVVALVCASFLVPLLAEEADEPGDAIKPFATGDEYFLHVAPAVKLHSQHHALTVPTGGLTVMHIDRRTGAMKCLFESSTVEVPTRRISYRQSRLLGAVVDGGRLYVATWDSGRIWDFPVSQAADLKGGAYGVRAFRLSDGKELGFKAVTEGVPEFAPAEKTDAGPLKVVESGVKLFGQTITVDDFVPRERPAANARFPLDR